MQATWMATAKKTFSLLLFGLPRTTKWPRIFHGSAFLRAGGIVDLSHAIDERGLTSTHKIKARYWTL